MNVTVPFRKKWQASDQDQRNRSTGLLLAQCHSELLILGPVQFEIIDFAILQRVWTLPWLYWSQEASRLLAYLLTVGNESVSTLPKGLTQYVSQTNRLRSCIVLIDSYSLDKLQDLFRSARFRRCRDVGCLRSRTADSQGLFMNCCQGQSETVRAALAAG